MQTLLHIVTKNDIRVNGAGKLPVTVHGHLPGMFNRIFRGEDNKLYAIQGFNPKARKWPIKTKRISDGEERVCSERFIKEILNE